MNEISIPYYFEMPAGFTTIRAHTAEPLQGEAHATAQIAYAQIYREETGREVALLRKHKNRLAVIVRVAAA